MGVPIAWGPLVAILVVMTSLSTNLKANGQSVALPDNYACENKVLKLRCPKNKQIEITYANYGRKLPSSAICDYNKQHLDDTSCVSEQSETEALRFSKRRCDHRQKCNINANNKRFGDPCFGTYKYLEVEYKCVDRCPEGSDLLFSGNVRCKGGKNCYRHRCFKKFDKEKWSKAVKTCKDLGDNWHLLALDGPLQKFFKKNKILKKLPDAIWLAGKSRNGKPKWRYGDGWRRVEKDRARWGNNQPDEDQLDSGCMYANNENKGKWFLGNCNDKKEFICMHIDQDDDFGASSCPPDWVEVGRHCHRYVPNKMDWTKASRFCKRRGGRLAFADDDDGLDTIYEEIFKGQDGSPQPVWFGMRRGGDNEWKSDGSVEKPKFFKWCNALRLGMTGRGDCCAANPLQGLCFDPDSCGAKRPFFCKAKKDKAISDHCLLGKHKCNGGRKCVDTRRGPMCVKQDSSNNICTGSGDPHFVTFDKKKIHYQGICTYVFTKPCVNDDSGELVDFVVYVELEHRLPKVHVSFLRNVIIEVYGHTIILNKEGKVFVDGLRTTTPWHMPGDDESQQLSVYNVDRKTVAVSTDFGLEVSMEGSRVKVKLPDMYREKVCGICGNWDGNQNNDLIPYGGNSEGSYEDLGESYFVQLADLNVEVVQEGCTDFEIDVDGSCTKEELQKASDICNVLNDHPSFESCRQADVEVSDLVSMCIYDVCGLDSNDESLCTYLSMYSDRCIDALEGEPMPHWRSEELCPFDCGEDMVFSYQADVSPASCGNPFANDDPQQEVFIREGCVCDDGLILSGDRCVPEDECGCMFNNVYMEVGEVYVNEDCSLRTICNGLKDDGDGYDFDEEALQCGANTRCKVKKGAKGCYCKSGYSGDPYSAEGCIKDDPCMNDPCSKATSKRCVTKGDSYECKCKDGFEHKKNDDGSINKKECGDINECDNPNTCKFGCDNHPGGFKCVCNDGFEANGKKCKNVNECKDGTAKCPANSRCKDSKGSYRCICKKGYDSVYRDGVQFCERSISCTASGDPHYRSFDGVKFDFQGRCVHTLTKVCEKSVNVPDFNVEVKNNGRPDRAVSVTKYVTIDLLGKRIKLGPGPNVCIGDVEGANLDDWDCDPFFLPCSEESLEEIGLKGVRIDLDADEKMVVKTDFMLFVSFDGRSKAEVKVPESFKGLLCGLCGNYNDDPSDDLNDAYGNPAPCVERVGVRGNIKCDYPALGNSYMVAGYDSPAGCQQDGEPDCDPDDMEAYVAKCRPITRANGPFKDCIADIKADPEYGSEYLEGLLDACAEDACWMEDPDNQICRALEEFAKECWERDLGVAGWRDGVSCPSPCSGNKNFSYNAPGCPDTCENPEASMTCEKPDAEGCVCPDGMLQLGDECVQKEKCGCVFRKKRYPIGFVRRNKDCSKQFTCQADGSFLEEDAPPCHENAQCKGRKCKCKKGLRGNGVTRCKNKDECSKPEWNRCSVNADCFDFDPIKDGKRYRCKCKDKYHGDGITCNPDPPCPENARYIQETTKCNKLCDPLENDQCDSENPSGRCICENGYRFHEGRCITKEECGCIEVMDPILGEINTYAVNETWNDDTCTHYECVKPGKIKAKQLKCGPNAACGADSNGEYVCLCDKGYEPGNPSGKKGCVEIPECQRYPDQCPVGTTCVEISPRVNPNGYECQCPNGEQPVNDQCDGVPDPIDNTTCDGREGLVPYGNNICLELIEDPEKYGDAKKSCLFNGGKLVVLSDEQMNDWVTEWLQNLGVSVAYLGLKRPKLESGEDYTGPDFGFASWVDGSDVTYANWASEDGPNLPPKKDCGSIQSASGQWYQVKCNLKMAFVCQYGPECSECPLDLVESCMFGVVQDEGDCSCQCYEPECSNPSDEYLEDYSCRIDPCPGGYQCEEKDQICCPKACPPKCKSKSHCEMGECVCDEGYHENPDTGKCVKDCPSDCPEHSECTDFTKGKCECLGYAVKKAGKCCPGSCPFFCGENSECECGSCVCKKKYSFNELLGKCVKGCPKNCKKNRHCDDSTEGKCVCDENHVINPKSPDGACCPVCDKCPEHSECKCGECQCLKGYKYDGGDKKCYKKCPNKKCPPNSFCDKTTDGKCKCENGYERKGSTCVKICPVPRCAKECKNGYRKDDEGCQTCECYPECDPPCDNGRCSKKGKCQCDEGYAKKKGVCVKECDPKCKGNERCNKNGKCVCKKDYEMRDGKCRKICDPACGENSSCKNNGKCGCNDGFKKNGDKCEKECDPKCKKNEECKDGKCVCKKDYEMRDGECKKKCDQKCGENSSCQDNGKCGCNDGYKKKDDKCVAECDPKCKKNEECKDGKCVCKKDYEMRDGECKKICDPACGENSSCKNNGKCGCNDGFKKNGDKCEKECDPKCGNKEECIDGQCICEENYEKRNGQCRKVCDPACGENSSCQNNGKCGCNDGYKKNGDKCEKECDPKCKKNEECKDGKCFCKKDYEMRDGECRKICDPACGENSSCKNNGKCGCNDGFKKNGDKCEKVCDPKCKKNEECKDGKCVCKKDFEMRDGECKKKCSDFTCAIFCPNGNVVDKDGCRTCDCNPECEKECGENERCSKKGKCVCKKGFERRKGLCREECPEVLCDIACVNGKTKDENECELCECNPDCNPKCGENSSCKKNGKCKCDKGYTMQNDKCVEECDPKCGKNEQCTEKKECVCKDDYEMRDGECRKKCDPECGENSSCQNNGKCKCDDGYKKNGDKCEKECDPKCGNKEECVEGQCVCEENYEKRNGQCRKVCDPECGENSSCQNNGKCGCNDGYKKNGDECEKECDPKCGKKEECIDGQCVCEENYEKRDGQCRKVCDPECGENSSCQNNGKCGCNNGFKKNGDKCEKECDPKCGNKEECVEGQCVCEENYEKRDGQCRKVCDPACGENSSCKNNGKCGCNDGYKKNGDKCEKECDPKCGNKEECVEGQCVCKENYEKRDGQCKKVCDPACGENSSCKNNGKCGCNDGFKKNGDKCEKECDPKCKKDEVCNNGKCVCKEFFEMRDGKCRKMCPAVLCEIFCANGYVQDKDGCQTCECNPECAPDCGLNERCSKKGKCVCKKGFERRKGQCRKECPEVLCDLACVNGMKKNENECEICECNPDCNPKCGENERCNRNGKCVCKRDFERRGGECKPKCVSPACANLCEHGYLEDADGCETCDCRPECNPDHPCPGELICITGDCGCPPGFVKDWDKCIKVTVCPQVKCAEPCPGGYEYVKGCQTCQCVECPIGTIPMDNGCVPMCPVYDCLPGPPCRYGYAKDDAGCTTCTCLPPPPCPPCPRNTHCDDGQCVCDPLYNEVDGECVPDCKDCGDVDCPPGGKQYDNRGCWKCTCKPGPPGPPCGQDEDCHEFGECHNGQCRCVDGYTGDGLNVCKDECTCRIRGDPIWDTYDGEYCILPTTNPNKRYTMTKYNMNINHPCSFMVEVGTSHPVVGGNTLWGATMPRFIQVWFSGVIYRFEQNNRVTVGGDELSLPYTCADEQCTIVRVGKFIVLDAPGCGIQVGFEGRGLRSVATIRVPGEFGPELTGMCGNCDGMQNDMRLRDNTNVEGDPKRCNKISESYLSDDSYDTGFGILR